MDKNNSSEDDNSKYMYKVIGRKNRKNCWNKYKCIVETCPGMKMVKETFFGKRKRKEVSYLNSHTCNPNLHSICKSNTTSSSPSARIAASLGVKDAPVSWEPSLETPLTSKPHPEEVDTEGKLRWKHMNTLEKAALLPSGNVSRPTSKQTLFPGGQLSFEDLDKTITPQVHNVDCSATTSAENSPVLKPRKKSKLEQTEVVVTKDQSCPSADEVDSWGSFNYEDIEAHESADKVQVENSFQSEIHLPPGVSGDDGLARLMLAKSQDSQGFLGDISLTTMEAMCQEAEKLAASKSKDDSPQPQLSSSPAAKSSSSLAAMSSSSPPAAKSSSSPAATSSSRKTKWSFLEHKGPLLAPEYVHLPPEVRFRYNGKVMKLEPLTEEVCTFYGKMLDHDCTTKEVFNKNFMNDWRKIMTQEERDIIKDLSKCDFSEINEHFKKISEERKARSQKEKKREVEANAKIKEEYGVCTLDGHQEKIRYFRLDPPGIFQCKGEHPNQGKIKPRLQAKDIIINCSKDSKYPEPPPGQSWNEIRHDNTVAWLARSTENINGQFKYMILDPSSKLMKEKDMEKYEKARELKKHIDSIRADYKADYNHKKMRIRQKAVALHFIDILALRAGSKKDDDQVDTVGCCSLRVEHVELFEEKDGQEYVIEFDFLGKDSIRYFNSVPVEKRVWKNVKLFKEDKKPEDKLFDRINSETLNHYLDSLMPGLTAKVFRTYNASSTFQRQLNALTDPSGTVAAKMISYNRANRDVAVLCNHQLIVPKTVDMAKLDEKIAKKRVAIKEAEKELKAAKKAFKKGEEKNKEVVEKKKAVGQLMEKLEKLEIRRTDEIELFDLQTSKDYYLDPRISVAWCKKHEVPIEKVYMKTQRKKFMWAINMAGPDYEF